MNRYDLYIDVGFYGSKMKLDPNGSYVHYVSARDEIGKLRELLTELVASAPDCQDCYLGNTNQETCRYCQARSLAEKLEEG